MQVYEFHFRGGKFVKLDELKEWLREYKLEWLVALIEKGGENDK